MARRVLIVDDNSDFRRLATVMLEADGYDVVGTARDASEAVAAARELSPEVVLLDVHLPDRSGFEVAVGLAAEYPSTAVLLISTGDGVDFDQLARASGARGFVVKDELSGAVLERVLG
jgi:two-component system, chemotaxis family, chemotaxis protein CheY